MSVPGRINSVRIATVKPQLTFEIIGQHSSGIHPPMRIRGGFRRSAYITMPSSNHIKENRFAIITIMLKAIASELREKWPHLHIKAHPMPWAANRARLVVRLGDLRCIFDIRPGPVPSVLSWAVLTRQVREDPNEYHVSVQVTIGNDVSQKKTPDAWAFFLDDPTSTIRFEKFIDDVVEKWVLAKADSA